MATFSRGGTGPLGVDYLYAIDWGDGQIDTGVFDGNTHYEYFFTVSGTHKYFQDGVYDVVTNLLGKDLDGVQKSVFGLGAALVFSTQQDDEFESVQAVAVSGSYTNNSQSSNVGDGTFVLTANLSASYLFQEDLTQPQGEDNLQDSGTETLTLAAKGLYDPDQSDITLFQDTLYHLNQMGTLRPLETHTEDDLAESETNTEHADETFSGGKRAAFGTGDAESGLAPGDYNWSETDSGSEFWTEDGTDLTGFDRTDPDALERREDAHDLVGPFVQTGSGSLSHARTKSGNYRAGTFNAVETDNRSTNFSQGGHDLEQFVDQLWQRSDFANLQETGNFCSGDYTLQDSTTTQASVSELDTGESRSLSLTETDNDTAVTSVTGNHRTGSYRLVRTGSDLVSSRQSESEALVDDTVTFSLTLGRNDSFSLTLSGSETSGSYTLTRTDVLSKGQISEERNAEYTDTAGKSSERTSTLWQSGTDRPGDYNALVSDSLRVTLQEMVSPVADSDGSEVSNTFVVLGTVTTTMTANGTPFPTAQRSEALRGWLGNEPPRCGQHARGPAHVTVRERGPGSGARTFTATSADGNYCSDNFHIEDAIDHGLDGLGGAVVWVPNNVFVSATNGIMQLGVNSVPAASTPSTRRRSTTTGPTTS